MSEQSEEDEVPWKQHGDVERDGDPFITPKLLALAFFIFLYTFVTDPYPKSTAFIGGLVVFSFIAAAVLKYFYIAFSDLIRDKNLS